MGNKEDKKKEEKETDTSHWTTQRQRALYNNNEGDWPTETGHKGSVCALCKSPINRYGFCSNRKCKYG